MKTISEIIILATVLVLACVWLIRQWKWRGSKLFANANNVPGSGTRQTGNKTYLCGLLADWTTFATAYPGWSNAQDATAPAGRYALVIQGADATHIRISSSANDKVLGVCTDMPDAVEDPLNVAVMGATVGTLKCIAAGAITIGDSLQSNGDGAAKTATTSGYRFGIALEAATGAGDVIEFTPYQITKYASI